MSRAFFIRAAKKGGGLDEYAAADALIVYGGLFMAGRFVGTYLLKLFPAARLLAIYSVICILLAMTAIYSDGKYVVYALCALGFFMSIMFPTIFGLGIEGLGKDTKIGSSLLVMSIIGGAILPYLMGTMIDLKGDDIQIGYYIPAVCYAVILYFAIRGYKIKQLQQA